jgi:hypothetical protein
MPQFYYLELSILKSPPLKVLWYSCIFTYRLIWWTTYISHTSNICSLGHHMSMSLILCRSTIWVWLLVCPTMIAFWLSSVHFLKTLCICLGLPHPTMTCPQIPCVTQKGSKELDLRKWLETWCRSQLLALEGVEGSCWKLRD